jgi:GntR family transcriptional regulator, transcriptional repressor for pyruvate dehydrogenase complex
MLHLVVSKGEDIKQQQRVVMEQDQKLFTPIKTKRSFEEVADNIKGLILNGSLKTGDKLPSETHLAEQFGVGRQTVREALRLLELSGFITTQTGGGGGSVIQDNTLRRVGDLLADSFRMRRITVDDLSAARVEIERLILEHVLAKADETDLETLHRNVAAAKERIAAGKMATELNAQFHVLLAKATKNEVFVIVIESILAVHLDLLSKVGADLETSREVVNSHEKIVKALQDRDRKTAHRLFEEHILEVRKRMQRLALTAQG